MEMDTVSQRQAALNALLPSWADQRRRVAQLASEVRERQAEHKEARETLGRTEASLDHVGQCKQFVCLLCEEIATNGDSGA